MKPTANPVARLSAAAVLIAGLLVAGCAAPAYSGENSGDSASEFGRPGAYIGLYGIKSYEQFESNGASVSFGNSDIGIGGKVGYRLDPAFAVEIVAEDVQGFQVSSGSAHADLDLLNFGAMGKFYFGTGRVQPYLLAGVGVARADVRGYSYDDDGGFFRAGLGLDVYLTGNFAVFGEANYNRMIGGVSDLHHGDLQAGILFRF